MKGRLKFENGTEVDVEVDVEFDCEIDWGDFMDNIGVRFGAPKPEMRAPGNIKFYRYGDGDNNGIVFENGKQVLSTFDGLVDVKVTNIDLSIPQPKLVKVDVSKRKKEHTYFRTNYDDMREADKLRMYCKYLGDGKYVYIGNSYGIEATEIGDCSWNHWYKVVE